MNFVRWIPLSLLPLLACAAAQPMHEAPKPYYLGEEAKAAAQVIPAPPAVGSAEQRAELDLMEAYQARPSYAADCKRANAEADDSLEHFFGPEFGPLSEAEVRRWKKFFANLGEDAEFFESSAKGKWKRPRPFLEDAKLTPCLPKRASWSYPSGHAVRSRLFADVLSALEPSRKEIFEKRAAQIGEDRVIGGIHHPSDIAAGARFADALYELLLKNGRFQRDFAAAKQP